MHLTKRRNALLLYILGYLKARAQLLFLKGLPFRNSYRILINRLKTLFRKFLIILAIRTCCRGLLRSAISKLLALLEFSTPITTLFYLKKPICNGRITPILRAKNTTSIRIALTQTKIILQLFKYKQSLDLRPVGRTSRVRSIFRLGY